MRATPKPLDPFFWLLPVLLAWALLASQPVSLKTASGQNPGLDTASTEFALRQAAPRLGFSGLAEKEAAVPLVGANSAGKLIGSVENLTVAEKSFVNEMVAGGKTVEIIPTSTGRTADFFIDGTRYELKTMSNVANQTSDGLSKALSSTIMDARGQSGNIVIDARGQAGMTAEIAERGIRRAFSADTASGSKIQSISIVTPQGTVYVPRLPQ